MNIAEARKALSSPLIFGNDAQIHASNLVALWEEAQGLLEAFGGWECETCDGEGLVDCECIDCGHTHDRKCPECKGEGAINPDIDHMDIGPLIEAIAEMTLELEDVP